ncbi:type III secretion protein U [Roseateles sp. YR242]|uniref:type III secretion system export apparatus subunit SctU n=1 Tax=Roseateles sp. YR242 TaxID=1855305 RepID=UPI0008BBC33C|nr:type III secretion system export apparatus subunit SctU [Roseateles sp. YR242]SEK24540.1 type III secretion protein U [Roseateles sp. YR242]
MGEKTEQPSQKKLDDAKKKGQSPKSQDINAAAGLLVITVCLSAAGSTALGHLERLFALASGAGMAVKNDIDVLVIAYDMAIEGLWIVLPFVVAAIFVGVIASFAQVGFNITFEPISPNFDKVNPGSGLKKLISLRSLIEFAKTVFKAILVGCVVVAITIGLVPLMVGAATQTPMGVAAIAWSAMLKLFVAAVIALIVIGPVDFALQRWLFIRDQRMDKDEVKREYKEMEGDPMLKGQRKRLAHEIANSNPSRTVPQASVVVTNPTHYAVALRYRPGETPLPIIVAKGADAQAMEIRRIAEASGVPIVGDPPLARALFKVPVDDTVPEALFEAVATVLRWVAMLDGVGPAKDRGAATARST